MNYKKLTDCCFITTGKLDSNAAIDNGKYPFFTCSPTPFTINNFNFDCDAIILAGNNASGNFHIQRYKGKFNAYQRTYILTAKDNYDINYIYYNLKIALDHLRKVSQGSQTKFLTMDILDSFRIPDIQLEEQISLVKILVDIDQKLKANNLIIANTQKAIKTLYNYWFLQFNFPDKDNKPYKATGGEMYFNKEIKRKLPKGWNVKYLKGLYDIQKGISYTTEDIEQNIGLPMINLASIGTDRNYKIDSLKYFNGHVDSEVCAHDYDLLLALTDLTRQADIVGSPILVPADGNTYTFSTDIAKITPLTDEIDSMYLYSTLRTDFYHNYIKNWASGTNVLHLDIEGLDWYPIWIPPKPLQLKFSEKVKHAHKLISNIRIEIQSLNSLMELLLPIIVSRKIFKYKNR